MLDFCLNPFEFKMNFDTTIARVLPPESPVARPRRDLLTPLPEPGHFLLVVDNSAIETFTTCPRYAQWHLVYAREAHARNAALTFGGAIHEGCESIELGDNETTTAQKVLKFFTENPTPPDEYRTPQTALELLAHYRVRKSFPDYQWEVRSDSEGLLVERAFEIPLGVLEIDSTIQLPQWSEGRRVTHIHVAWSGRIDLVANCNSKNRVVDHKTTSIGGDQFIQDFQLNNATLGYVWASRQLWPELQIDGFCLNAFHLKRPAPGQGLMSKGARGGEPPLKFFRAYFDYSENQLKEWEENAMTLVEDFVHCLVRGFFPLHTKWCFAKYGKCQYHDICTLDEPAVRLKMLQSDAFKDVTWDPTK